MSLFNILQGGLQASERDCLTKYFTRRLTSQCLEALYLRIFTNEAYKLVNVIVLQMLYKEAYKVLYKEAYKPVAYKVFYKETYKAVKRANERTIGLNLVRLLLLLLCFCALLLPLCVIGFDVRRHFGLNFVCAQRRRAISNVRLDLAGLRGGMPPKQKKTV
jgi:hypothetical protein